MKATSFRTEREFGLITGSIFSLLGAWWSYRGKFGFVAPVVMAFGMTLVISGALIPRALVYPHRVGKTLTGYVFSVITWVILILVFYLVVTPIGFVMRLRGWDPLRRRSDPSVSYWEDYSERQSDPRHYEKMY